MPILDENEKLKILNNILESSEFKDSKRYQDLLKYLFNESKSNTPPKEITIGTEFFNKSTDFDPKEDPTVRVYLNNLRKKIDHYYLACGNTFPYRLEIPKGHYKVEFIPCEEPAKPLITKKYLISPTVGSFLAILILLVAGTLYFFPPTSTPSQANNPVWSEFMTAGGRPTLILLGDFFFLYERKPDGKRGNFVRNYQINSMDDFKDMIKADPTFASQYVQSDFTFLRPSASWGLSQILPVIQGSPNSYSLKLASQFSADDLKTHNIIFIGSFKTLYSLNKFFHVFGLHYSVSPNMFEIRDSRTDSVLTFSPQDIKGGNYEKDFAIVAKGFGPDGSTIMLLLGFSDSGVIEAARAVTDSAMLSSLASKADAQNTSKPFHFTMVVETEGYNQSIYKSQIRYFSNR